MSEFPTLPAVVAAVAHLVHLHAETSGAPEHVRVALSGSGHAGIAGALQLVTELPTAAEQRQGLLELLSAAAALLPPRSAARDACGRLATAVEHSSAVAFEALARILARHAGCAEIMREVDHG